MMLCWATTLCSLIGDYQHCAGSYHLHLHLYLEHEGNMVLGNNSNHPSEKHNVNVDMKSGISGFSVVGFGLQCSHNIQGECEVEGIDWFTGFALGVTVWMYNAVWSNGEWTMHLWRKIEEVKPHFWRLLLSEMHYAIRCELPEVPKRSTALSSSLRNVRNYTTSDSALHVECLEVSATPLWKCHFAVTLLFTLITWSLCTTSHHPHSDCKTPLPLSCSHSYLKLQLLCKSRHCNCFNTQNCWMA